MNSIQRIEEGKRLLYANRKNRPYTVPSPKLYPFQWNWDSGFVTMGLIHFDLEAAFSEIRSLLSAQWQNGMIPHIAFHAENITSYFPNCDFWNSAVNAGAPQGIKTSGITQPPVLGFILERMLEKFPDDESVINFLQEVFPSIVRYHQFFYTHRDPLKEGLAFIYHPWESGRDNSPLWDAPMSTIKINKKDLPIYERQDIQIASSDERPTDQQYDQYIFLLQLGKAHKYEGPGIAEASPFLIQDTLINALLIKSNESLIRIGNRFGMDVGKIKEWNQQSIKTFKEKLWNPEIGNYCVFDMRQKALIPHWEIGGLTSLYAEIADKDHAIAMQKFLEKMVSDNFWIIPSFDPYHELYDSKRYWRGPIWPQMNWLIYKGLGLYGMDTLAEQTKQNLIDLITAFGFREYFEAQEHIIKTGKGGYGGDHFSWTAACFIDLLS